MWGLNSKHPHPYNEHPIYGTGSSIKITYMGVYILCVTRMANHIGKKIKSYTVSFKMWIRREGMQNVTQTAKTLE